MDGVARHEGRGAILSVAKLPHPPNWSRSVVRPVLGILFASAIAVFSLAQSVVAFSRGNFVATVVAGGFALTTLSFLCGLAVLKLRSKRLIGTVDEHGTSFRPDPLLPWLLGCSFVGGAISSGLVLLLGGACEIELPFASPGRASENIYMSALFVICLIGVYALIVRGRFYLRLTSTGLESADILHTRSASWDDITAIADTAVQKHRYHPISFFVKDTQRPIEVNNASGYATNGAALYWMVRHYWLHPENRGELADGRALERLRTEDFVPE